MHPKAASGTSNQGFSNQVVQVSPDAVAEFKVVTNNYSAEYGRAGGAIINASVKSGTNQFHGAAWEFLRNTQLNAIGFFQPRENKKPTLVQNQFGAALGGPIRRDKLFFFGNYEGFRRVTTNFALSSVATLDQRAGRFTDAAGAPLTIQNPLTLKIDYFLNSKLNVFGRYSHRQAAAVEEASLPTPSGGSGNGC